MELDEFHVDQFGPGVIRQGVPVAGAFPTVAGDLVGPPDAAGGEDDGLGVEDLEAAVLAFVAERADDAVAVLQQRDDGAFHVDFDALVDAVVLQGADHFQAGAVADVGQARIAMAAEISLQDSAVLRCDRRPRPRLPVRARDRALPWREARPCASC